MKSILCVTDNFLFAGACLGKPNNFSNQPVCRMSVKCCDGNSLRGSSDKIGTILCRLAWSLAPTDSCSSPSSAVHLLAFLSKSGGYPTSHLQFSAVASRRSESQPISVRPLMPRRRCHASSNFLHPPSCLHPSGVDLYRTAPRGCSC